MAGTTTYYGVTYPTSTDYVKDGATAIQTVATGFDSAVAIPTYNAQTGATYTFALTDVGKTVTASNASASTYTIPPTASVAWPTGTTLNVTNLGAGVVTFAPGAGVTVTNTAATLAQYASAALIRTGLNAWTVVPKSGGASGLTLISSTSFSAVASVNITSCFSATYTNYKVMFYQTHQPTANRDVTLQLLATTTPATTAYYQGLSGTTATNTANNSVKNNGGEIVTCGIWDSAADTSAFDMTVFKPFLANRTTFAITNFNVSSGVYFGQSGGALHSTQTSYNGFSLATSGTNFGGVVKVYGIQD